MTQTRISKNLCKTALLCLISTLALAGSASAADTENVIVKDLGGNSTSQFSSALQVQVLSPSEYERGCCTDSDSGEWLGPRYFATDDASLSGRSGIDWSVESTDRAASAQAAAEKALIHNFQTPISSGSITVPRYVGSTRLVGIAGYMVVKRAASPSTINAEFEAAVAFPIATSLYSVARFSLLSPYADQTGLGGQFMVASSSGNVLASTWNNQQAQTSLTNVTLQGNLSPKKVTASVRSDRVRIRGFVKDIFDSPLVRQTVRLQKRLHGRWRNVRSTTTATNGSYSLRTTGRGTYRAYVTLGTVSKASRTVNI